MSTTTQQHHHSTVTDTVSEGAALPRLLSIDDVATYLGVSVRWVYTQVRTGRLPAMLIARSWRVRREALEEFAESFRVEGDG